MAGDIQLGIRLKYDGKEVTGGVLVNREDFKRLAQDASAAGKAITTSYSSAAEGVRSISEQLGRVEKVVGGIFTLRAAADFAGGVLAAAQSVTTFEARLKVATDSAAEFASARSGVFDQAQRWGQALETAGNSFARLNPALAQMGGNAATTLKMLDGVNGALRISGATTAESSAVMLQFAQAMGSGVVQGDEFRSLMEGAQPLMREVAAVLGVTTGQLKKMGSEGKLTSEVFGNAVLQASDKLTAMAESVPLTLDAQVQKFKNSAAVISHAFVEGLNGGSGGYGQLDSLAQTLANSTKEAGALGAAIRASVPYALELVAAWALVKGSATIAPMIQQKIQDTAATVQNTAAAWQAQRATVAATAAEVERLTALRASVQADLEFASAQRAAAAATLNATAAIGVQSAALREKNIAMGEAKAAIRLMSESSTTLAVVDGQLATASRAHADALAAGSVAARAKSGALSLLSGAVTALGGPLGIAITGTTLFAGWLLSSRAQAAALEEQIWRTKRAKDALAAGKAPEPEDQQSAAASMARWKKMLDDMDRSGTRYISLGRGGQLSRAQVQEQYEIYKAQVEAGEKSIRAEADAKAKAEQTAKLTASVFNQIPDAKWASKVEADYQQKVANLDKGREADIQKAKGDADQIQKIEEAYQGQLASAKATRIQDMQNLPGVKEARAESLAQLKAGQEQEKALLEERNRTIAGLEKQGVMTAEEAINAKAAAQDIWLASEERAAAKEATIAKKSGDIAGEISANARVRLLEQQRAANESDRVLQLNTSASDLKNEGDKITGRFDLEVVQQRASTLAFEASLIGKTASEQAVLNKQREIDLGLQRALLEVENNPKLRGNAAAQAEVKKTLQETAAIAKQMVVDNQATIMARNEDWTTGATTSLNKYLESARNVASSTEKLFDDAFSNMEDALVSFVQTGKLDFSNLANSIIADIVRIEVKAQTTDFVKSAGGVSGVVSALGGLLGLSSGTGGSSSSTGAAGGMNESEDSLAILNDIFGGGRAGGGAVSPGVFYRVNERDPELLTVGGNTYLMMGAQGGTVRPPSSNDAVFGSQASSGGGSGEGGGVVVNVIESQDGAGQVRTRQTGGQTVIDVLVAQVKSAMALDIAQGGSVVPTTMERTYGLNRVAGAY